MYSPAQACRSHKDAVSDMLRSHARKYACNMQGAVAATHMVQAFHKAGVPPGVINLVTGAMTSPCSDGLGHVVPASYFCVASGGCIVLGPAAQQACLLQGGEVRLETT